MKKRINEITSSSIFKNFFYLSLVQGSNFILPLISIPYLIRVLGAEKFGLVAFSQAFIYYFIMICDYGFNVSAVREIAVNKNIPEKIDQLISNIYSTKIVLIFISFLFLIVTIFSIPKFHENFELILLTFGMVIGQTLFPIWYFQGIERMKYIAYFNLFSKILFTVLIFMLINSPRDYLYVNLYNSLGNIISAIACYFIIKSYFKVKIQFDSFTNILLRLKTDWLNFVANFSINFYMNSNIIILGFFANDSIVGYYSVAEKILTASKQLITIFFFAIYPKVCVLAKESYSKLKYFLDKILGLLVVAFFTLGVVLFFGSEFIILFFSGNINPDSVLYLNLFSFVPLIISINVTAYQTLLAFEQKKIYTIALFLGSIVNLIANFVLVPSYSAIGTCFSIIITEIFVTIALKVFAYRYTKKIIKNGLYQTL